MNKIFVLAGEASGDKLAAWFVKHKQLIEQGWYVEGIGGEALQGVGIKLYDHITQLNAVGIVEIIKKSFYFLRYIKKLVDYLIKQEFQEVVLIDFPGFNLRIAQALKKRAPHIIITYFSPPQLWCWGAWRLKKLKLCTDRIIVLYPFEIEWYAARGIRVDWLGSPLVDRMQNFSNLKPEPVVAFFPGSRLSEVKTLLPISLSVLKMLACQYQELKFIIFCASTIDPLEVRAYLKQSLDAFFLERVQVVTESQKSETLKRCCLAITKPGTVTLELGLLHIPHIIFFKTHWLNYLIGRLLVHVNYMGLPNLLLNEYVSKELIQKDCTPERIVKEASCLYESYKHESPHYDRVKSSLERLGRVLSAGQIVDK